MSFEKAAAAIKSSGEKGSKLSNDELSKIYGLYKQAMSGDNTTEKPGMLDLKGKAKWEAWNTNKGKSTEDAKAEYVEVARNLLKKYGFDDLAASF